MSLDPGFATDASRQIFDAEARVRSWLDVEAALAKAQAELGIIPEPSARAIDDACRSANLDAEKICAFGWQAGSPVIPMVDQMRALLAAPHRPFFHRGATTQDILDTGQQLQIRRALEALEVDLESLGDGLATLADTHRGTEQLARSLMQPARATTFGLTVAGWLDPLSRHLRRLRRRRRGLALQLGGAIGDSASFGEQGIELAERLGKELGLVCPELPWHAARDRVGDVAAVAVLYLQTVTKVARDLILLAQGEVGEVSMRAGGSSAMPGKRNPIDAIRAVAASSFAAAQADALLSPRSFEHRRAAGAWHLEWQAVPMLFHGTLAATEALRQALESLEVRVDSMATNCQKFAGSDEQRAGTLTGAFIDRVLEAWHGLRDIS